MDALLRIAAANTLGAAAIALLALTAMLLLRRPALTHVLWLLVLLKLLMPPVYSIPVRLPSASHQNVPQAVRTSESISADEEQSGRILGDSSRELGGASSDGPIQPRRTFWQRLEEFDFARALLSTWICGFIFCASVVAIRMRRFHRILSFADSAPPHVVDRVASLSRRLGIRRPPATLFIPAPVSPMLLGGIGRPRLLIPKRLWEQLDNRQRDALLLHELAHMRRLDHLVRGVELLATVLHWWNPLTWLARRQLRIAEELCCDAWVTWLMPAGRDDYAAALVEAIEFASLSRPALPLLASGVGEFKHLQRRLLMIRNGKTNRKLGWTIAIALIGALALPFSLTRAQEQQDRADSPTEVAPPPAPLSTVRVRKSVQDLVNQWKYREALALVDKLLAQDPNNTYGIGVRPILQDKVQIEEQKSAANGTTSLAPPDKQALFDRRLPELDIKAVPFADVIKMLEDISGLKIGVAWKELEDAGINRNTPITLYVRNVEASTALRQALAEADRGKFRIRYAMDDKGIVQVFMAGSPSTQQAERAGAGAGAGVSEAYKKAQAQLDRIVPDIKFDKVDFSDVIDFLRDVTGLNIQANWKQLEAQGVKRDVKIEAKLVKVKASAALDAVLQQASDEKHKLAYRIDDDGIVEIFAAAAAASQPAGQPPLVAADKKTQAQLDRVLPELNFEGVALSDVIQFLRDVSGANIVVNWKNLEAAGVKRDAPVTIKLRNIKFSKALTVILESAASDPTTLTYKVDQGVITISAQEQPATRPAGSAMRVEDAPIDTKLKSQILRAPADPKIQALLDQVLPDVNFTARAMGVVIDSLSRQSNVKIEIDWATLQRAGIGQDIGVTLHVRNARFAKVLELVCNEVGGGTVDYAFHDGKIIVSTTAELAKADAKMQAQLDQVIPVINFREMAISDAIDFLRKQSGADIFVNWKALERVGVNRKDTISLRLRNVKLSKVLTLLLERIGEGNLRLGYTIDDGIISISTESELVKNTITRVFDVRDIVGAANDPRHEKATDDLIKLIIDEVDTASWRETGGRTGSLRELQGQLIVTQTPENHHKVMDLLQNYREAHRDQLFPTTPWNLRSK
jgi:beta-lactamase regulating signal transducer with metallopeptidase domain